MGHIFPFSPKRGTPAARMPQVAPAVVRERARRLREATARRRGAWLQGLVGTKQKVLLEKNGFGHSENFAPVRIRSSGPNWPDTNGRGSIVDVLITSFEGSALAGVPA
jgi:threonylcarbamoyladenosine tRNA methylthiotransferase MtaB